MAFVREKEVVGVDGRLELGVDLSGDRVSVRVDAVRTVQRYEGRVGWRVFLPTTCHDHIAVSH